MRAMMIGLAALAVGAGAPAHAQQVPPPPMAGPMQGPMMQGTMLEVTATGRTTRVPDMAVVSAGVTTQAPTAAQAYAESNAKMAKIVAALRAAGVAERDIQTSSIELNPQYRGGDNQAPAIFAYQASNSVTVRFRDVARAGPILDVLVREGANTINGPNLMLSAPEAAMDEARIDAVAQARARAELYAKAAGLRVDRILSISDGRNDQPIVVQGLRARVSSAEVMPGEQEVTATVTIRFLLK